MTDFLLEILSEEIPAGMQKAAAENFAKIASEILTKNNLVFTAEQLNSFITPRRLTLYISNLEASQKTPATKKVGPKINADKRAIEGFLKSVGLSDESELEKTENNGHTCYAYIKPESEIKTDAILKDSIPQILQKMVAAWPKLMRWDVEHSSIQPKWIRPIRNIACLFGGEIIEVEFAGLKSNDQTFGHFLKSCEPLKLKDASDYKKTLSQILKIEDLKY
jgi:glycyl-tRNA synthetase beta chain